MVVARKSRKQTAHRTLDFSGAAVVKPESEGLAAWIGIKVQTPARMLVGPEPGVRPGWSCADVSRLRIVFVGRFVSSRSFSTGGKGRDEVGIWPGSGGGNGP